MGESKLPTRQLEIGTVNSLHTLPAQIRCDRPHLAAIALSYVKVKGDKSPFDGDIVDWRSKLGTHPELPSRTAKLLKQQKGKCQECGLSFQNWDVWDVDHKTPKALGGTDEIKNLQLLHLRMGGGIYY